MNPLLESITSRFGGPRQTAIIALGLVIAAGVYYVSQWATRPVMVPLFANVPVESVKAMTDKLQEAGIAHELDAAGTTILVQSQDVARARVDLAAGELLGLAYLKQGNEKLAGPLFARIAPNGLPEDVPRKIVACALALEPVSSFSKPRFGQTPVR